MSALQQSIDAGRTVLTPLELEYCGRAVAAMSIDELLDAQVDSDTPVTTPRVLVSLPLPRRVGVWPLELDVERIRACAERRSMCAVAPWGTRVGSAEFDPLRAVREAVRGFTAAERGAAIVGADESAGPLLLVVRHRPAGSLRRSLEPIDVMAVVADRERRGQPVPASLTRAALQLMASMTASSDAVLMSCCAGVERREGCVLMPANLYGMGGSPAWRLLVDAEQLMRFTSRHRGGVERNQNAHPRAAGQAEVANASS